MWTSLAQTTGADDERASAVVPDLFLPSQYFDRIHPRIDLDGPRRLMLAVLEDAVHLFVMHAAARDPRSRALFGTTEAWFEDTDNRWLFSFERICAVLDLDPDYLRHGLRARRRQAIAMHGTESGRPRRRGGPARGWPRRRASRAPC